MIDTTALTAPISAFRAEVAQNSVSPEKVEGILQQIVDALSKAASNSEVADFLALQERLQALTTIYTSLTQGTADRNHIYLTPTTYNVGSDEHYTNADSIRIQQATTERAGAMRAQQVIDLNTAKKNITELQTALQSWQTNYGTLNSAVSTLQEELKFLQEDTEMNGEVIIEIEDDIIFLTTALAEIQDIRTITVEVKDRFLTVQGAGPLLDKNMQPYLFRLTKKSNRKRYTDSTGKRIRKKNKPRKGWHLMGDKDTLKIDRNTLEISINTTALGANYAVNEQDFHWVVCHEFEKRGWQVEDVYLGNPMRHDEKYLLINQGFAGKQRLMPFFNRQNNDDLILAIQTAGVVRGRNGFRKDKGGEKLDETEENLLEHRTDGTDAFDTLYIGTEKFPYREMFPVTASGVL